jgi:hypothetical protein
MNKCIILYLGSVSAVKEIKANETRKIANKIG